MHEPSFKCVYMILGVNVHLMIKSACKSACKSSYDSFNKCSIKNLYDCKTNCL